MTQEDPAVRQAALGARHWVELAATAEEMTTQTANLAELMRFFQTGGDQRATGGPRSATPDKQTQRAATVPTPRLVQAQPWRAGGGVFEQF